MENLIHIVFDTEGAENIKQSFDLDDIMAGELVVLEDDLAFGPLKKKGTDREPGRQEWWNDLLRGGEYTLLQAYNERLIEVCQKMRGDGNNEIWIWAAQNAKDVCGYYALLAPLADFLGRVHLIYLNNLPFINEKGSIFYPTRLSEILPKEFLKARRLAREITAAEVEVDGEEWNKLKDENARVRVLEGGKKISGQADDYFDKALMNRCRLDFMKTWRLVSQVKQKGKDHVNEDFLYGRLQALIDSGALVTKDDYKNFRDCEVKTSGAADPDETAVNKSDEQDNQ